MLSACAAAEPPSIAASLVEGPSEVRSVGVQDLVDDASDSRLGTVLDDAGFVAGTERTWIDRPGEVWRTVVRALRFGSPDGARVYVAWVGENIGALIGPATRATDSPLAYEHAPSDCCPNKDGPQALAATVDGDVVWTVTLAGPAASADRAISLLPPND